MNNEYETRIKELEKDLTASKRKIQTLQSLLDETVRKLNSTSNSSVSIIAKGITLHATYNSDFYIEPVDPDSLIISTKTYTAVFSNVSDMHFLYEQIAKQIAKRASGIKMDKLFSDESSFDYKNLIINNHYDDEFNF